MEHDDRRPADPVEELLGWYRERDALLTARARGCPAGWGGNFRVGPGDYVTEEEWYAVLPSDLESSLYYAVVAALDTDLATLPEVASRRGDEEWLAALASDYVEYGDAEVYYTEFFPGDYGPEEQLELARERPDLFTPEELGALAGLIGPRAPAQGPPTPTSAELLASIPDAAPPSPRAGGTRP